MNLFLRLLKEARYIVFILTIFAGFFMFYDTFTHRDPTYDQVIGVLFLLSLPTFVLHTLYAIVRVQQQKLVNPLSSTPLTTFGLPDKAFIYAYLILALLFVLFSVSTIDKVARDAARDRANRMVPDQNDSSTWALPEAGTSTSVQPPISREQLLSGSVTIQSLISTTSEKGHAVFGDVQFIDGVAQSCVPGLNDELSHACDAFVPGMFTIRDAIGFTGSTSPQIYLNDNYVVSSGFVLIEYYYNGTADTLLTFAVDYPSDDVGLDTYSFYPLPYTANTSFVQSGTIMVADEVRYDELTVATADGNHQYVHMIDYVRNGPNTEWFEMSSGMIERAWPVNVYDEFGAEDVLGTQAYRFVPGAPHLQWNHFGNFAFTDNSSGSGERVYFKDACEVPYTYSDIVYRVTDTDGHLGRMSVSFPRTTNYILTTSRYGYEPSEWGTVLEERSVAAEQAAIMNGVPFNEHAVEKITISGTPVRHTLPYLASRPCEDSGHRQIYQWVQGGNIYSLSIDEADTPEEHLALQSRAEEVIKQLMAGLSYVPAEGVN